MIMKYKTLLVIIVFTLISGCSSNSNMEDNVSTNKDAVVTENTFVPLEKPDSGTDGHIGTHIEDPEEFAKAIEDIEVVEGMSYDEYMYSLSDKQSDNIDIDNIESIDIGYDLSMIKEEEIKNVIKALYIEGNASSLEILKYGDVYEYDELQYVECTVKIDNDYHFISYDNGVAYSIVDKYGVYEEE